LNKKLVKLIKFEATITGVHCAGVTKKCIVIKRLDKKTKQKASNCTHGESTTTSAA
jgi:hypothetical protein